MVLSMYVVLYRRRNCGNSRPYYFFTGALLCLPFGQSFPLDTEVAHLPHHKSAAFCITCCVSVPFVTAGKDLGARVTAAGSTIQTPGPQSL